MVHGTLAGIYSSKQTTGRCVVHGSLGFIVQNKQLGSLWCMVAWDL